MKISLIKPNSVNVNAWTECFKNNGIEVLENKVESDCDFIICASHSQDRRLAALHHAHPHIPMINYNWDLYGWIWKRQGSYDWKLYGELLDKSAEIWCPSEEVVLRTEEFFGLGDKCRIIKTYARIFDYNKPIPKGDYIYQPMRHYRLDKNFGWLRKACDELNIPLKESLHKLSEEDFRDFIANCRFMCTEYHEASTGGLTLIEGYRLGKPVVISNSKYMGARDYFGNRAIYFDDNSYENFKKVIKDTWENTPILDIEDCKKFVDTLPSIESMVAEMISRLEHLKAQQ